MKKNIKLFNEELDSIYIDSFLVNRMESYNHNIPKSNNWFYWKFFNRPVSNGILTCIFNNNRIVGCNSFGDYPLVYNKTKVKSMLSYENFLHPSLQKKGFFKQMIDYTELISKNRAYDLLMVFPNMKSLKSYTKQGWIHQKKYVNYYLKPLFSLKLLFNIFDIKQPFVPNTPLEKNTFNFYNFNSAIYKDVCTSFWSNECLNWRFNEMPQSEYCHVQLDCIESVGRLGKRGELIELQIIYINSKTDKLDFNEFKNVISYFKRTIQPDLISFPMSIYNPYLKTMSRNGFLKLNSNTNFVYKSNSNQNCDKVKISLSGIDFHTY